MKMSFQLAVAQLVLPVQLQLVGFAPGFMFGDELLLYVGLAGRLRKNRLQPI